MHAKLIQEKAINIYNDIKNKIFEGSNERKFITSHDLFMRFKARNNHNIKMSGEADSTDNVVTRKFSETLEGRISEGDYDAQ